MQRGGMAFAIRSVTCVKLFLATLQVGTAMRARTMPLLHSSQLIRDTYEVERYLAEGAFAEVYRVKHKFLGRQAMKVFKRTGMTRADLDQMMAEAVLLSRLAHPNIVQVFDANTLTVEQQEYGYFTMENVPGGSLDHFWRSHGARLVPVETTVDILKQVCRGLVQAHTADPPIIHRDIKPQNILIGYEADGLRARISDFGLAKQVNKLTLYATAAGTLAFKPPEVFAKAKGDSVAADIWALGMTLYMLLTDRIPFKRDEHIALETQAAALAPPDPPSKFNISADHALDCIVTKCLAFKPEDRYGDAKDLLEALNSWAPGGNGSFGDRLAPKNRSQFSKEALGHGLTPNEQDAEGLAARALDIARRQGSLKEAADMMEEAFNQLPSLRERHASKITLWRRGISM